MILYCAYYHPSVRVLSRILFFFFFSFFFLFFFFVFSKHNSTHYHAYLPFAESRTITQTLDSNGDKIGSVDSSDDERASFYRVHIIITYADGQHSRYYLPHYRRAYVRIIFKLISR